MANFKMPKGLHRHLCAIAKVTCGLMLMALMVMYVSE